MKPPKGLTREEQLYANLMDEARQRIHAMRDVVLDRDRWLPRLLQEFCYLQLRILCEQIAVGCLIVHGEVQNKRTLKNWKIPNVMNELQALNPDFYPRGIRVHQMDQSVHLYEYDVPQLTQSDLIRLWRRSGDYLHRGSAEKLLNERPEGPVVDIDEIIQWGQKIINLLEQHVISSSDKSRHLLVFLSSEDHGGKTFVVAADGPAQNAT